MCGIGIMNVWVVDLNSRAEEKLYVNSENAIDALDANIYENVEDLAIYTNLQVSVCQE